MICSKCFHTKEDHLDFYGVEGVCWECRRFTMKRDGKDHHPSIYHNYFNNLEFLEQKYEESIK